MSTRLILLLLAAWTGALVARPATAWQPDVLGPPYTCLTIALPPDGGSPAPVCTLVRRLAPAAASTAVLYVHGYNDYFFQAALGDSAAARGYAFYALDLRDYGRSIRPGRDPFWTDDLRRYHTDLDSALAVIGREGYGRVALMAHSTGGLIAADYLRARGAKAGVAALVLNSPFLDWNFGWAMKRIVLPTVGGLGRLFPRWKVQGEGGDTYARSLLRSGWGEWTYDTLWKKPRGWPKRAGWIRAVTKAQRRVVRGGVACPVLVLSSGRSLREGARPDTACLHADIVLSVSDIRRRGVRLGRDVTLDSVAGGMHDLILSPRPARDTAYRLMFDFIDRRMGRRP